MTMLASAGLIAPGAMPRIEPMTGGVASDIWKVASGGGIYVVKRALPKLRVAAEWRAPVSRNAAEADWFRTVRAIAPEAVPEVLAQDAARGFFAMPFFPPQHYPVWKSLLRAGTVDLAFARQVGRTLGRIHAATAGDSAMAARFPNAATFHAIRLEPYLEATAARHPDLAGRLMELSRATRAREIALVHGDVSPKNILAGPRGPIFLDAECATYGDPAFDLAFCLKHLLLKCLWTPPAATRFLAAFDALEAGYFETATFEPRAELEARIAALLPALFLARIDGKSPVEYIVSDADRDRVRRVAAPFVLAPPARLQRVRAAWAAELRLV